MRKKKVFDFISDPGHGWLKVPYRMLNALDIAHKISSYSYTRNGHVYLEEDCDAYEFVDAYRKKYGETPTFREKVSRTRPSKIRSYDHYTVPNALDGWARRLGLSVVSIGTVEHSSLKLEA